MNKVTHYLVITLSISLAFNLFLTGFVVARLSFAPPDGPEPEPGAPVMGPHNLFRAAESFGGKASIRRLMSKHGDHLRPQRKALHQARLHVAQALEADPFDPQRLENALGDLRSETADSQKALHMALLDLARTLTSQQRKELSRSRMLWNTKKGDPGREHHRKPH